MTQRSRTRNRIRRLSLCVGLAVLLAGGTAAAEDSQERRQQGPQRNGQGESDRGPLAIIDVSSSVYLRALELKASGDCDRAIPLFYRLAQRGEGFELAQFHLGECLVRAAEQAPTDTRFLAGLVWIRRAAEAGAPQAQATLALFYLGGPEALRDREEAALWYVLFESNPQRKRPGFSSPLSETERQRIESALGDELRARAAERAKRWQRSVWAPPDEGLSEIGENVPR